MYTKNMYIFEVTVFVIIMISRNNGTTVGRKLELNFWLYSTFYVDAFFSNSYSTYRLDGLEKNRAYIKKKI